MASSNKLVREAVLVGSSGDPALDRRMQMDALGLRVHSHTPLEKWTPLRIGPADTSITDAVSMDDEPALPENDCAPLEAGENPRP